MGQGNVNNFALNNNPNRLTRGAGAKLPPPPKGYSRIWIDVSSSARKDKAGEVHPSDSEIEKALFARFGLAAETEVDMSRLKERLAQPTIRSILSKQRATLQFPLAPTENTRYRSMSKNRFTRNFQAKRRK